MAQSHRLRALWSLGGLVALVLAIVLLVEAPAVPASSGGGSAKVLRPSRLKAHRFAHRSFVRQKHFGKRHFKLLGSSKSVTAADGSRVTAFPIILADSGDGTGQAVLLFHNKHFVGWSSGRLTIRLALGAVGRKIVVRYGVFRGNDPLCCPSSTKRVKYRWNGSRIVSSGTAPLAYGHKLSRLRLAHH
jgi:hypothetical protein